MPWTKKDVEDHVKGLDEKQTEAWLKIANSTLSRCAADGGEDCDSMAIRTANAMSKRVKEDGLEEAATVKATALRLSRDLATLLADRTVPEAVRKEAEDLRVVLKKTWADLAADADKDGKPDVEELETEPTMTEEADKPMKTVGGESYPASDFLVVPDPQSPSTWALQVKKNGVVDHGLMGGAWAALHGGYRGNKYEGEDKGAALTALKALYKAEEMEEPGVKEAEPLSPYALMGLLTEQFKMAQLAMGEQQMKITQSFQKRWGNGEKYGIRDVFAKHPKFGDAVLVQDYSNGKMYAVPYTMNEAEVLFEPGAMWQEVVQTYMPVTEAESQATPEEANVQEDAGVEAVTLEEEALVESATGGAILAEGNGGVREDGPLTLRVKLIEPGMGNKKQRHWYGADMLKRDAYRFKGAKMFETDHNDTEKSTRTWVSTITNITGFSDTGAPLAEVVVHDPNFAKRVRNLNEKSLLTHLPCSIYATGDVKKGVEMNGEKVDLVERITDVSSVDWVTRAGAGGQAIELAENDAQPEPEEAQIIKEDMDMTKEEIVALVEQVLAEHEAKTKEQPKAEEKKEEPIAEKKEEPKVTGLGERAVAPDKQAAREEKPLWERQVAAINRVISR